MTDKKGFSTVGGSATLLDDENQKFSPADKEFPLLTEKDVKAILAKEVNKLEAGIEQAYKLADKARDEDDEKKAQQHLRAAENNANVVFHAKEIRITIEGNFCTFRLGSLKEGINLAAPPKDILLSVNRLIFNYSQQRAFDQAKSRNPKGSKLDYSGMGQIIRGKDKGEAA